MELPASFTASTRTLLGDEAFEKLVSALQEERIFSVRLNESKVALLGTDSHSLPFYASFAKVPWCGEGFYLDRRLTFTFDPLFHAGCYYVQEASSMFVEQALKQYVTDPVVMLDLCAAPGGKSTHARSVLPEGSLLVANEVIRNRSQILAENLTKWGHPDVVVTNNDPADFSNLEDLFDVILTDVPCSGEGMFRKDPVAVSEWSDENVEICWQRQRRILSDIWLSLKPGGLLIYSTCTYNTKEDEENVQWIRDELGAEVLPVDISEDWNITGNLLAASDAPVYRFLPHRTRGEGFFLAVLRKVVSDSSVDDCSSHARKRAFPYVETGVPMRRNERSHAGKRAFPCAETSVPMRGTTVSKGGNKQANKKGASGSFKEQLEIAKSWLQSLADFEWSVSGTTVTAFRKAFTDTLSLMQQSLRIVQAGIVIAELKGKDIIPNHSLAMSDQLLPDAFARVEISYENAIAYLRKEAIALPDTAPLGYVLLIYKNVPLGFVKNIGNRANNLYPQEWRIRSGYLPEEVITIDSIKR